MNIAFDAAALFGPSRQRGMGYYVHQLLKHILDQDHENQYFLFNCLEWENAFDKSWPNFHEQYFYLGEKLMLSERREFREIYGRLLQSFICRNKIDVFVITAPFSIGRISFFPQGGHLPVYQREWLAGCRVVAIAYDLIPMLYPDRYLGGETREWYEACLTQLKWVDHVLSISECTSADLVKYLHLPAEQITCIWGGYKEGIRKIQIHAADWQDMEHSYGIEQGFIMAPLGDDPRKNICELICAYALLPEHDRKQHQLVIVCQMGESGRAECQILVRKHHLKGRVILTGFVPDEDMIRLYNMAELVAFPSQYEGFGMPIAEAFACGKPVLTSNNSSCAQVAGDAAYLVDPFSIDDMARGLHEAFSDAHPEKMVEKGSRRLRRFQWSQVAKAAIYAMNALTSEKKAESLEKQLPKKKKRLAFFTPLPPLQSGISDYSVDVLGKLSQFYDIDVFIDDGYQPDCTLPDNVRIYRHDHFLSDRYDDVIYQYGNSTFHSYMDSYIKTYHGTVELHDVNLSGILMNRTIWTSKNLKAYGEALRHDLPKETVEKILQDASENHFVSEHDYILNGFITDAADRVIVHSNWAKHRLIERNVCTNVQDIPHYTSVVEHYDAGIVRNQLGMSEHEMALATFGFVHETKRAIPLLRAVHYLHQRHPEIRMYFVGKLDSGIEEEFRVLVKKYHMEEYVCVTGFVNLETFQQYLEAADIVLQLRYPYNGENSGSLCRALGKGKCTVISDIGSFSEVPDEACVKIPSAEGMRMASEVRHIESALEKLIEHPEKMREIGHQALAYAKRELDIEKIVKQYVAYLETPSAESVLTEAALYKIQQIARQEGMGKEDLLDLAHTLNYCWTEPAVCEEAAEHEH